MAENPKQVCGDMTIPAKAILNISYLAERKRNSKPRSSSTSGHVSDAKG